MPIAGASFEPSVPLEGKEAIWFVVSRAARLHAGPSVSSPITHLYPVGTELKLIGYAHGWFQVSDPATLRQGWIYEKYYLQAISGPGQTRVAVQDLQSPTRVAFAASKPKPVSRVKKPRSHKRSQNPGANSPSASPVLASKWWRGHFEATIKERFLLNRHATELKPARRGVWVQLGGRKLSSKHIPFDWAGPTAA